MVVSRAVGAVTDESAAGRLMNQADVWREGIARIRSAIINVRIHTIGDVVPPKVGTGRCALSRTSIPRPILNMPLGMIGHNVVVDRIFAGSGTAIAGIV